MISVVRPCISSRSAAWICCSIWTSIAEVASSSTRIGGLTTSVRAIAIRWRWPARQREAALADDRVVAVSGARG